GPGLRLCGAQSPAQTDVPEVFGETRSTLRVNFDTLAARRLAPDRAVRQGADGAIFKVERGDQIILTDRVLLAGGQRVGGDAHRLALQHPVHEIDEVARLAKDRAADLRIGHPVRPRNAGRVDAALHYCRRGAAGQHFFQLHVVWRESSIEPDGELAAGFFHRGAELAAFFGGDRDRLFHEDVLSR